MCAFSRSHIAARVATALAVCVLLAIVGCEAPPRGVRPAPPAPKTPHIGYLTPVGAAPPGIVQRSPSREAFVQGLAELGYVEGQNVVIDNRLVREGEETRLPEMARELVDMPVDVIVALGAPRVEAAKQATSSIPIVMALVFDPVEAGLVLSLARPGENVTGVATRSGELAGKRLEILKRAVPSLSRVAVLATPRWRTENSPTERQLRGAQQAAATLGIELAMVEARDEGSRDATAAALNRAIGEASDMGAEALFPLGDALFDVRRTEIATSANARALPTIYSRADYAEPESGGLLGHGPDTAYYFRRVAWYVDKILKGVSVATLPIEQPDRYELVVNLTTANAIGMDVPASLLLEASRIVY